MSTIQTPDAKRSSAERDGYQVHEGKETDGTLHGRHWWSLSRPGWIEAEVSPDDFATADEAWDDAIKHHRVELASTTPFAP